MVGDLILLFEKKETSLYYTLKYILFVFIFLSVSALLYYVYVRFIPSPSVPSPAFAKPRGTVILDAGHGGMDGGAVSDNGTLEKELNLQITLMLRDLLEVSGIDVILTRDSDIMLESKSASGTKKMRDLRARVEIAEANPDAVFVSIHMNKFPKTSVSGLQLYCSPNADESHTLAEMHQSGVKTYLQPDNNRPIKTADSAIYILDRIKNPAVLVECGFLSNYDDEQLLLDSEYQRKLVLVLASSLMQFIDCNY